MDEILHRVNDKKIEYLQCIEKYTNLLKKTYEYEQEIQQEIDKLREANKNNAINDTSFVHQKSVLENKINSTRDVKQKILKNLTKIKQLCDDIYLKTDKSEFDSAIMINALIKNISELNSVI
jgi:predicted O-linked N-acetylglucosamine transferase (SPINDLY family)